MTNDVRINPGRKMEFEQKGTKGTKGTKTGSYYVKEIVRTD